MSSPSSTLLADIQIALADNDPVRAGKLVCQLTFLEPRDWLPLLSQRRLLPDIGAKNFARDLAFLGAAMAELAVNDDERSFDVANFLAAAYALHGYVIAIERQLVEAQTPRASRDVVLYQLANYVEDQTATALKLALRQIGDGPLTSNSLAAETIAAAMDNRMSALGAHETVVEDFQLVVAHLARTSWNNDSSPSIGFADDYLPIVQRMALLATVWRWAKSLYADVVFLRWRIVKTGTSLTLVPSDFDEAHRAKTGEIRRQQQLSGMVPGRRQREPAAKLQAELSATSKAIELPVDSSDWCCNLDPLAVRRVMDVDSSSDDSLVDRLFYRPLADALITPNGLPWWTVRKAWRAVRAVALLAASSVGEEESRSVIIPTYRLAAVVAEACDFEADIAARALQVLTFDHRNQELELWDTPLVPVRPGCILLIPSVAQNGLAVRQLENMTAEWAPALFDERGTAFEGFLAKVFTDSSIPAVANVVACSEKVEYDLAVFWDGWLLLFEGKCTKSVFTARDMYRAGQRAKDAAEQVRHRRLTVLAEWDAFRSKAAQLNLPIRPLDPTRVLGIAVLNVPHFTGLDIDGVIVTDEFCIQRFFGNPLIQALSDGKVLEVLGRIYSGERSAETFINYLRSPAQVALVSESLQERIWLMPEVGEAPKMAVWGLAYEPKAPFS